MGLWPFLTLWVYSRSVFFIEVTAMATLLQQMKENLGFLAMCLLIIAALLAIGFQIWLGTDYLIHKGEMTFSITILFPLLAAFLDVLAARSAMTDEMMVAVQKRIKKTK